MSSQETEILTEEIVNIISFINLILIKKRTLEDLMNTFVKNQWLFSRIKFTIINCYNNINGSTVER